LQVQEDGRRGFGVQLKLALLPCVHLGIEPELGQGQDEQVQMSDRGIDAVWIVVMLVTGRMEIKRMQNKRE
jgi:hypothetical protein